MVKIKNNIQIRSNTLTKVTANRQRKTLSSGAKPAEQRHKLWTGGVLAAITAAGIGLYHYFQSAAPTSNTLMRYEQQSEYSLFSHIEYLATHMHPKLQLVGDGSGGCHLPRAIDKIKRPAQCQAEVDSLKQDYPKEEARRTMDLARRFQEKGVSLGPATGEGDFWVVAINPDKKSAYKKALLSAEQHILIDKGFFESSTNSILMFFGHLHQLLMSYNPQAFTGVFRPVGKFVFHVKSGQGSSWEEARRNDFLSVGVSKEDIDLVLHGPPPMQWPYALSAQQKEIWSKIGTFMSPPHEIYDKMTHFVDTLKVKMTDSEEPVALAAWAHGELLRIHPWHDGNGRFARLILNMLLARGGMKPVIFPNDDDYLKAILTDNQQQGAFELFLRYVIIPWNEQARSILTR